MEEQTLSHALRQLAEANAQLHQLAVWLDRNNFDVPDELYAGLEDIEQLIHEIGSRVEGTFRLLGGSQEELIEAARQLLMQQLTVAEIDLKVRHSSWKS